MCQNFFSNSAALYVLGFRSVDPKFQRNQSNELCTGDVSLNECRLCELYNPFWHATPHPREPPKKIVIVEPKRTFKFGMRSRHIFQTYVLFRELTSTDLILKSVIFFVKRGQLILATLQVKLPMVFWGTTKDS